jgi:soluble cytochrome b562
VRNSVFLKGADSRIPRIFVSVHESLHTKLKTSIIKSIIEAGGFILKRTAIGLIICICLLFASTLLAASSQPATKNIFPDRYDEKLARLYRPEDRIVYIFREMTLAHFNQQQDKKPVLNEFLKIALNRYWLLESNEFRQTFANDTEYYLKRVKKYISKLPSKYDKAAFSFMFAYMEEDLPEVESLVKTTTNAVNSLDEDKYLKEYCQTIAKTPKFYREIPIILKPAIKIEEKIGNLLYQLQKHFLIENMILSVDSLISSNEGKLRDGLIKFKKKLNAILIHKILTNLEVQLESGLEEDTITGIMISGNNLVVTQVLYQGRIRTFVKRMQRVETFRQLRCFLPIVSYLRKRMTQMKKKSEDPQTVKTLEKMDKNLDQMTTILQMKLKNKSEISQEFQNQIDLFDKKLNEYGFQKLLSEL